jgi:hypothetical protein
LYVAGIVFYRTACFATSSYKTRLPIILLILSVKTAGIFRCQSEHGRGICTSVLRHVTYHGQRIVRGGPTVWPSSPIWGHLQSPVCMHPLLTTTGHFIIILNMLVLLSANILTPLKNAALHYETCRRLR